jgi:hypothetical protein
MYINHFTIVDVLIIVLSCFESIFGVSNKEINHMI